MRRLIEDGRVHVFDGAMGTVLYAKGVFVNVCYDELCVSRAEVVRAVHDEYVRAGANIIETNTFGANPVKLSSYGLSERTEEINTAAGRIARQAAGERALVAGAIGPLGIRIEPWGPTAREEAVEYFGRQIDGLLAGGVDGILLETFSDLSEIGCALQAARARCDLPVFAQMTVGQGGKTAYGTEPAQIARELSDLGADAIGLNCSVGPAVMLDAIEEMAEHTSLPLVAQPNAGLPRTVRDRKIYLASPEYMAQYARRMIDAGVRFVGGCCGTTPAHVKLIRNAVVSVQPRTTTVHVADTVVGALHAPDPVQLGARSALGRKLSRGETVVSVELLPPLGWDKDALIAPARALKVAGVDTIAIVDNPRVAGRMGALAAALLVEREVGTEALLHYTCRDRNMLGMLSDLLGAAAAGLKNLLVVSGDPPLQGPYPDATAVFDIDSIGLTNVVQGLNRGLDPGGNSIGAPTEFVQGVAANPGAVDLEREIERFAYKAEAGADFAITQPVFDPEALARFLERTAGHDVPVLAGIWPLVSARDAEFLANEVPGVVVPATVVERMREASERGAEAALEEGIAIALEVIVAVGPQVRGFHLAAPGRRVEVALRVLREAGVSATA